MAKYNHYTQICIVTGATGAIGDAIARGLAQQSNTEVTIVARNQAKAEKLVAHIRQASNNPNVDYLLADLGRKAEIYALAESWNKKPLHLQVNNNAGEGIYFHDGTTGIVQDNECGWNAVYGIEISSTSHVILGDNYYHDNGGKDITD